VLSLLAACSVSSRPADPAATTSVDGAEDTEDTAAPMDGCDDLAGSIDGPRLRPTSLPFVFAVDLSTSAPASVSLQVATSADSSLRVQLDSDDGLHHSGHLIGVRPDTQVEVVAEAELADGQRACAAPVSVHTGSLSAAFPVTTPGLVDPDRASGWLLAPMIGEDRMAVGIFDDSGHPVWGRVTWTAEGGAIWTDDGARAAPMPVNFRLRLDPAGRGVVFNTQPERVDEPGHLVTLGWGGELLERTDIPGAHTDFLLLPDGRRVVLGWDIQERDGRLLLGDTLLVDDGDGVFVERWNVFDHFRPDPSREYPRGFTADEPPAEDWTHANGLGFDPSDGTVLLTMTEPSAVVKVDPTTGDIVWVLSGRSRDFPDVAPGLLAWPHSVQAVDGGLLVFNRTVPYDLETCSHAVELAVDPAAGTAEAGWAWLGERCRQNGFLGNAQRLDSGHTVVVWSSLGIIEQLDAEGRLVGELSTPLGTGFGFGTWVDALPGVER
jgi:hypothetical protein